MEPSRDNTAQSRRGYVVWLRIICEDSEIMVLCIKIRVDAKVENDIWADTSGNTVAKCTDLCQAQAMDLSLDRAALELIRQLRVIWIHTEDIPCLRLFERYKILLRHMVLSRSDLSGIRHRRHCGAG